MQKATDRFFFVEATPAGESEYIDTAQFSVTAVADQFFNCGDDVRIG